MGGSNSRPTGRNSTSVPTAPSHFQKKQLQVEELGASTTITLSKNTIDFSLGEKPCPLRVAVHDQFTITNASQKQRLKFSFEPSFPKEFQLSFTPSSGTLDKGKSKTIKVKLTVQTKININHKVTLKCDEIFHFVTVRIRCETGVFGVDPTGLEQQDDEGYVVPSILVSMKRSLIEHDGISTEGIFRLAGEQTEIRRIKETMNKKEFTSSNDVNSIASLIKIWFRELPNPILNCLPAESIFYSNEISDCVAAFDKLPEPQRTLLDWLLHLLLTVASNSSQNKMSVQNLAIVVAPNLYDVASSNPMEGLVMSQKCVQFIHNILLWKTQNAQKITS